MNKYLIIIYNEEWDDVGHRCYESIAVYAKTEGEALFRAVNEMKCLKTVKQIIRIEIYKLGKLKNIDIENLVESYYNESKNTEGLYDSINKSKPIIFERR